MSVYLGTRCGKRKAKASSAVYLGSQSSENGRQNLSSEGGGKEPRSSSTPGNIIATSIHALSCPQVSENTFVCDQTATTMVINPTALAQRSRSCMSNSKLDRCGSMLTHS